MNLKKIVQPVGFFGIGAMLATFFVIASLFVTGTYGLYWFWFYAAILLLALEAGSQITGYKPFGTGQSPEAQSPEAQSPEAAKQDRPAILLNLLCFAAPPLGLLSWLLLDSKLPFKARSAGRSGVRGALVILISLWWWNTSNAVNIAVLAIERAQLQPVSAAKAEKRIAYKKWLRQQARRPKTTRPATR